MDGNFNEFLKMDGNFNEFLKMDNLNVQSVFETSVYFNKYEEVTFLLDNYKHVININMFVLLNSCKRENLKMFTLFMERTDTNDIIFNDLLSLICKNKNLLMFKLLIKKIDKINISSEQIIRFLSIANFVPFVMDFFEIKLDEKLANELVDVAIKQENNTDVFEYLIQSNIQNFISEYKYTLIATGAGRLDILKQLLHVLTYAGDECIETAFLKRDHKTVQFLLSHVNIKNIFLAQQIRSLCECCWRKI